MKLLDTRSQPRERRDREREKKRETKTKTNLPNEPQSKRPTLGKKRILRIYYSP